MDKIAVMDQLEALKAVTNSDNGASSEDQKGRERAAGQWVSHFIAVTKIKENFLASDGKPEEFTKKLAEKLLVAEWDVKRDTAI